VSSATALALGALLLALGSWALWFRAIQRVAVPRDRRGYLALMLAALALGIAAFGHGAGWLAGSAAAVAIAAACAFLATVAISRQKGGPGAFEVGRPLPDFEALGEDGAPFRLSSLGAGRPLLLKFFRGHW